MNENEADSTPAQAHDAFAPLAGQGGIAAQGSAQREPGASPAVPAGIPPRPDWLKPVHLAQPKKPPRRVKPFDLMRSSTDADSFGTPAPEGAKLVIAHGIAGGHFVPVSFAAQEWNVTPRRIRFLLSDGRLAGRLQDNGYWQVRYPYSFTFGTRGPGLKRQQKQERRAA